MGWWQKVLGAAVCGVLAVGLGACGGSGAPEQPDDPESITRELLLVSAPMERARAIEVLGDEAGLSQEQAAALLDALPGVVAGGLSHDQANTLAGKLSSAGMTTRIRRE